MKFFYDNVLNNKQNQNYKSMNQRDQRDYSLENMQ